MTPFAQQLLNADLPSSPNYALIKPDAAANYPQSADELLHTIVNIVKAMPRIKRLQYDRASYSIQFDQLSRLFRFVDTVQIAVIPTGPQQATVAMYSYSHSGYYDFGVNKRRLNYILKQLNVSNQSGSP